MPILIPSSTPTTEPPAPPVVLDATLAVARVAPVFGPAQQMLWEPGDGSVWDLSSPVSPVQLGAGVVGLGMPPVQHFEDEAAAVDGARWRGHRMLKRPVVWPLTVYTGLPGGGPWLGQDAAFWATLSPSRTGVWRVRHPMRGTSRALRVRFVDDNDHAFVLDPALLGWARYVVRLQAEWPYWQGEPVVREFRPPADVGFFAGPGVINISPGGSFATAAITNPGDVDAYLTYYAAGPITAATVRGTQLPAIAAGKGVILDTSPASGQVAWDADVATGTGPDGHPAKVFTVTGVDRTSELGAVDFSPVPPGGEVPVPMTVTGTGTIRVELVPDYYRAW